MIRALRKMDIEPLPAAIMIRQPIYDENLKVAAYELLYQDEQEAANSFLSESEFAIHVMLEEYTSVYEAGKIRCLPAYIRLSLRTAGALRGNVDANEIIVELDAASADEAGILTVVKSLTEQGFKIALANYTAQEYLSEVLSSVHAVRIDLKALPFEQIEAEFSRVRNQCDLQVLAENIDSIELFDACVAVGFDLFQGQFLSNSKATSVGKLNVNQTAILELISELQKPDASPKSIEQIVQVDPVLTYKLLRIVNSAAYSLVRVVTSIADTIVMLGLDQVRQLAIVITTGSQSNKPLELYRSMLIRGHMCEVIAMKNDTRNNSAYFLAGIMSGLHLLLDTTPENIQKHLPVGDDIKAAVLDGTGSIGEVLKNSKLYETGNWENLQHDIDIRQYEFAYMESIRWVNDIMGSSV